MSYSYDYSPPSPQAVQNLHEEKEQRQQQSPPQQPVGKQLWLTQHNEWTARKHVTKDPKNESLSVPLDRNFDYDSLIGAIINETPFASPIPLPLLVDTLVDLWESDGVFE